MLTHLRLCVLLGSCIARKQRLPQQRRGQSRKCRWTTGNKDAQWAAIKQSLTHNCRNTFGSSKTHLRPSLSFTSDTDRESSISSHLAPPSTRRLPVRQQHLSLDASTRDASPAPSMASPPTPSPSEAKSSLELSHDAESHCASSLATNVSLDDVHHPVSDTRKSIFKRRTTRANSATAKGKRSPGSRRQSIGASTPPESPSVVAVGLQSKPLLTITIPPNEPDENSLPSSASTQRTNAQAQSPAAFKTVHFLPQDETIDNGIDKVEVAEPNLSVDNNNLSDKGIS